LPIATSTDNDLHAATHSWARELERLVHRYFLVLLIASYLLAAVAPAWGQWLRDVEWRQLTRPHGVTTLSQFLLAVLLFLAGLGIDLAKLWASVTRPVALSFSLVAKLVVPTTTVFVLATIVTSFTDDYIVVQMLLGLALVAAMPAAGSSPAWTQTAGGDVALSLGIVVGSTLLGPWFGGVWLSHFAQQAGQIDQNLVRQIAAAIFGSFFLWWVLIPSILGIVCRYLLGRQRMTKLRPYIRLAGSVLLLVLIYAFAAKSLARVSQHDQAGQLTWAFGLATILCVIDFGAGWCTGKLVRPEPSTRVAMIFGIGMHNNGIALLVADSLLLKDSPAFLPIIAYAMVQHLIAGATDALLTWRRAGKVAK
jgi:BASS family bile acid:Na+ symporter